MANKAPSLSWFIGINMVRVKKDLERRPELTAALGSYRDRFIRWAGEERVSFEADIDDEVECFLAIYKNKRLYNLAPEVWKQISKMVFERDAYTCAYCGERGGILEVDHITPISKGGSNDLENLTTACRRCNRQKKDMTTEEYENWKSGRKKV